jgi:phosphatidylethanolamine-binding protein (PEBP) family uncharacterized protein
VILRRVQVVALVAALAFSAACSTSGTELRAPTGVAADGVTVDGTRQVIAPIVTGDGGFTMRSETFEAGAPIATFHTFAGDNSPPPLLWDNVPEETTELALVMRNADKDDVIYWVVTGMAPESTGLIGGVPPPGAVISENEFAEAAYRGPDTPAGLTETYVFTLYALAEPSGLAFDADPVGAVTALEQSALTTTALSTTHTG